MHKRIFARLDRLDVAVRAEEMNVPGFDFHSLHGFDPKRYSVHVNGPWCITFEFEDGKPAASILSNTTEEQTCPMQPSAAKPDAQLIPVRCFAMTSFRLPAGPRRKSPDCSGF